MNPLRIYPPFFALTNSILDKIMAGYSYNEIGVATMWRSRERDEKAPRLKS
jgi:hypothetical protein